MLGRYDTGTPGPSVVLFGAVHGNEPAGVRAIWRLLDELRATGARVRGRIVGFSGNRGALARGVRFIDRDLNRRWTADSVLRARARGPEEGDAEDREQAEILACLRPELEASEGPAIILDLHSTSGKGAPFACMSDTLRNREVAMAIPVPVILGLEEVIDGAMLGYLSDLGHRGIAVEGGQHDDPLTADHHLAAVVAALDAAGVLDARDLPGILPLQRDLAAAASHLPQVVEVRYRHVLDEGVPFEMEPGFVNFDVIRRGQVLARDERGPVHAPEDGRILLPRYQGQGEDGFFVGREVRPAWLSLSRWVRASGLDRHLALLPGVQRHPERPDCLVVQRERMGGRLVDLLHLGGYRRRAAEGPTMVFSRRRPDGAAGEHWPDAC